MEGFSKLVKWLITIPGLVVLGVVGYFLYQRKKAGKPLFPIGAVVAANGAPVAPSPLAPQVRPATPAPGPIAQSDVQQAASLINAGTGLLKGITALFADDSGDGS